MSAVMNDGALDADEEPAWHEKLVGARGHADFVSALRLLRDWGQTRSIRDIALNSKRAGHRISAATVHNALSGVRITERSLIGFLVGCGLTRVVEHQAWLDRYQEIYRAGAEASDAPGAPIPRRWIMAGIDARSHFTRRSRGHRSRAQDEDLFRGRDAAVDVVMGWLTAENCPGRPAVVTGQPGAGKSAVLAKVVLALEALGEDDPTISDGVAIHARGMTAGAVVQDIAAAMEYGAKTADGLLDAVEQTPRSGLLAIAVDALDEVASAADRRQIVDLLTELARLPHVRVAVATRPMTVGDRYVSGTLLRLLGVSGAGSSSLVDLDMDRYFDFDGLLAFTELVLAQHGARHPGPAGAAWKTYRLSPELRLRLANEVARRAHKNFLVAALAATYLASADSVVDPVARGFDNAQIPASVGEAMTKYLDTLPEHRSALTLGVLTALAYARGSGLDDRRWMSFAEVLGYTVTQTEIDVLRESPAADFLLETSSDSLGRVTRLFHQALVDELLQRRNNTVPDENRITAALLPASTTTWRDIDAYTSRHVGEHAAVAGRLADLLQNIAYLAVSDLDRLMPLLPANQAEDELAMVTVLRAAAHRARSLKPVRRLRLFSLTAAHLGLDELKQRFAALDPGSRRVVWAHSVGRPHQQISTSAERHAAVAIGSLGGRDVIVTATDKELRVWDADGVLVIPPLAGHSAPVTAVWVGQLNGRDVIVSGGRDQTIRVWDADGQPVIHPLVGHAGSVQALAVGTLNGVEVIVSAGYDRKVCAWSADGQLLWATTDDVGHTSTVYAVIVGRLGEADVVVSGGLDNSVRIWDSTGHRVGEPLLGHQGSVQQLAITELEGRSVVVSVARDGEVRIWDGATSAAAMTLGAFDAVCFGRLSGMEAAIVADRQQVRAINLGGEPVGQSLTGYSAPIRAVALGRLGHRDVVVTIDREATRVWEPTGRPVGSPRPGHTDQIRDIAIGRLGGRTVIASGCASGTLRLWDTQGHPWGRNMAHSGPVNAVAFGRVSETDVVAVAGNQLEFWTSTRGGKEIRKAHSTWHRSHQLFALAIGRLGTTEVAISAGYDGYVRAWNLHQELWSIGTSPAKTVRAVGLGAVATLQRSGNSDPREDAKLVERDAVVLFASGETELTVQEFDGFRGAQWHTQTGHTAAINALAIGRIDGLPVIVSASDDGTVRLWRQGKEPLLRVFAGHEGPVRTVAIGRLGGRDVIISAGADATIRIWDPRSPRRPAEIWDLLKAATAVALLDDRGFCASVETAVCAWADIPREVIPAEERGAAL
jgi:WD40 repeat protein